MDDQVKQTVVESNESVQAVGFVTSTEGATVVVIAADGSLRELNPGDPLHEGDVLQVTDGSHVVLTFADGSVRQLSSGGTFEINQGNFHQLSLVEGYEEENPEFQELLAALEAGEDISEDQEATAAGEDGGGGDEIGQGLQFTLTGDEVTPTAGIDPDYIPPPLPDPTADIDVADEPLPNRGPEARGGELVVSEEGLEDGLEDDIGSEDTTNSTTASVDLSVIDPDGDTLFYTLSTTEAGLTSGGVTIEFIGNGGDTLVGRIDVENQFVQIITISVDGNGNVSTELLGPIDHPDDTVEDDLSFNATLNVSDGALSDNAVVKITIEDDSPNAELRTPEEEELPADLLVDESPLPESGDGITSVTEDFSVYFVTGEGEVDFGADGPADADADVLYSLRLSSEGMESGLYALDATDTAVDDDDGYGQGDQILLFTNEDGVIEGKTSEESDDVYFTIDVDTETAEVTFSQSMNIWHSDSDSADDPAALSLSEGETLKLVQTVTDADDDTGEAAINLAGSDEEDGGAITSFTIEDDAPLAVDDVNPSHTGDVTDNDDFGTDGEGGFNGWADTVVDGKIVDTQGTLTANTDGTYSFIWTDNTQPTPQNTTVNLSASFDYEIIDADGDTSTATLSFSDTLDYEDIPVVVTAAASDYTFDFDETQGDEDRLTVNDTSVIDPEPDDIEGFIGSVAVNVSALATANVSGGDGDVSAASFSASVLTLGTVDDGIDFYETNLTTSGTGDTVYLYQTSDTVITGYTDESTGSDVALTITLSSNTLTINQVLAFDQGDSGVYDELQNLQLTGDSTLSIDVTASASDTDYDGVGNDSDSDTATYILASSDSTAIRFEDDGPTIESVRTAIMSNDPGNSLTDDIPFETGTDGGSLALSASNDGTHWMRTDGSGARMTSDGHELLYRVNLDGSLEAYYLDADNANAEVSIFTVTDNGDGTYTVDQPGAIDGVTTTIPIGFNTGGFGGGNSGDPAYFLSSSVVNGNVTTGTPGSIMVKATTLPGDTVNFNNNALGVSQGSTIDDNSETLILTLSEGDDWTVTGSGANTVVTEVPDPGGNEAGADAYLTNTVTLSFWGLDVGETPVITLFNGATEVTVLTTVVNVDGTWTVTGALNFDTVKITAFDTTGNGFGVSSLAVDQTTAGFDQTIEITATVTDGDLDTASTTWDFTFDGTGDLMGTSGDDIIQGNGGIDVLVGSLGNDILIGDAGADSFDWNLGDAGTGSTDTITDFNQSAGSYNVLEGDVLDLSGLLVGEEALDHTTDLTLAQALDGTFLAVTSDGTDTTITADVDGAAAGTVTQTIVIEGTDLTNAGALTSAQVVESLLTSDSLVVD